LDAAPPSRIVRDPEMGSLTRGTRLWDPIDLPIKQTRDSVGATQHQGYISIAHEITNRDDASF